MKSEPFESTPEFAAFDAAMRKIIKVSKPELDKRVAAAKEASPRKNNPKAPGQKKARP